MSFFTATGDFPQAVVVILSSVIGYSLVCLFLSVLFRNRWVAWMLAYLFLLLVLILPPIFQSSISAPTRLVIIVGPSARVT